MLDSMLQHLTRWEEEPDMGLELHGVVVTDVRLYGAAWRAGVRAGDSVIAWQPDPVNSKQTLHYIEPDPFGMAAHIEKCISCTSLADALASASVGETVGLMMVKGDGIALGKIVNARHRRIQTLLRTYVGNCTAQWFNGIVNKWDTMFMAPAIENLAKGDEATFSAGFNMRLRSAQRTRTQLI